MNSKLILTALTGAASLFAAPASAETFDGPYLGIQGGWSRAEVAGSTNAGHAIDAETSRDSFVLGGYAGYNHRLTDRFLIGAEAGFSANFDDDIRTVSGGSALTIDPRYSFDLTARAGYLVDDKTLVYARGGYANTRVRTSLAAVGGFQRESDAIDGWLVGGGVERAITERISTRLEYRYADFGSNGGAYDRHQALVGISYKF